MHRLHLSHDGCSAGFPRRGRDPAAAEQRGCEYSRCRLSGDSTRNGGIFRKQGKDSANILIDSTNQSHYPILIKTRVSGEIKTWPSNSSIAEHRGCLRSSKKQQKIVIRSHFMQERLSKVESYPSLSGGCPATSPLSGHRLERQGHLRQHCLLRRRSYGAHGDSGAISRNGQRNGETFGRPMRHDSSYH